MIEKRILCPDRVRKIGGSFAFVEHRFLRDGFWVSLTRDELLLYFLLVMAADREGVSYYGYEKLCDLLTIRADDTIAARNALIDKDLIAFEAPLFQVLSLPAKPLRAPKSSLRPPDEPSAQGLIPISRVLQGLLR
jgi:hypothetical protein